MSSQLAALAGGRPLAEGNALRYKAIEGGKSTQLSDEIGTKTSSILFARIWEVPTLNETVIKILLFVQTRARSYVFVWFCFSVAQHFRFTVHAEPLRTKVFLREY